MKIVTFARLPMAFFEVSQAFGVTVFFIVSVLVFIRGVSVEKLGDLLKLINRWMGQELDMIVM